MLRGGKIEQAISRISLSKETEGYFMTVAPCRPTSAIMCSCRYFT